MCIHSFKNICAWPVLLLIVSVTAKIKTELKEEGKFTPIKSEENVGGIKSKDVLNMNIVYHSVFYLSLALLVVNLKKSWMLLQGRKVRILSKMLSLGIPCELEYFTFDQFRFSCCRSLANDGVPV